MLLPHALPFLRVLLSLFIDPLFLSPARMPALVLLLCVLLRLSLRLPLLLLCVLLRLSLRLPLLLLCVLLRLSLRLPLLLLCVLLRLSLFLTVMFLNGIARTGCPENHSK
jgi:hypothetical protein